MNIRHKGYVALILLGSGTLLFGCAGTEQSVQGSPPPIMTQDSGSNAAKAEPSPDLQTTPLPTQGTDGNAAESTGNSVSDSLEITTGTYLLANANPLHWGEVQVVQTGNHRYRLTANTLHGLSHSSGQMEFDCISSGGTLQPLDAEYQNVTLQISESSLTIDYPQDELWGGINAEPRGTYYLQRSSPADSPFVARLYQTLEIEESYLTNSCNILTFTSDEMSNILLVQLLNPSDPEQVEAEYAAVYNTQTKDITAIGELSDRITIKDQMTALGVDDDIIYEVLHKTFADRFREVQMARFDQGQEVYTDEYKLTESEAFYIVTGLEGSTSVEQNNRDANNVGSILVTDVDHSDDDTVTIHVYEIVRNDDEDIHTATADWLEVNRMTGRVVGFFE